MSLSTASRLGSQNNSERPSSSRTSTAACSDCPQHAWIVPCIPANSVFQCPSLTRTAVPLRASYAFKGPPCFSRSGPEQLCCRRPTHHDLPLQHHTCLSAIIQAFKPRKIPPLLPVRSTSKAQRSHPRSARQ